jgi:hypothetical protein
MSRPRQVLVVVLATLLAIGPAPFAPEAAAQSTSVTVSVNPGSGPTGTQATVTVTGPPNSAVTLSVGPGSTNGVTDANGTYTTTETFTGRVGDVITIKADVGSPTQSGSTTFTITAPGTAFGTENSAPAVGLGDPFADRLRQEGWNDSQVDIALRNGWSIGGQTQSYGFGDDPLSEPGVPADKAAATMPLRIGYEYVRFTDTAFLPPQVNGAEFIDDTLWVPLGDGVIEPYVTYVWWWAEMAGDIDFDATGIGYNWAFLSYALGETRYNSDFLGDSWDQAAHMSAFWNDPVTGDWNAELFTANSSGGLDTYSGPGGMAWASGNLIGFYAPADAVMGIDSPITEYGFAADYVENPSFQFDPDAPRRVTVYPPNFSATGRDGGLEPNTFERFPINVGFNATYADTRDAVVYRNTAGDLWAALYFLQGWPLVDPIIHFLITYFSFFVGAQLGYADMFGPFVGTETHAGEAQNLGFGTEGEFEPSGIHLMEDGSLRFKLEYTYDALAAETDRFDLRTSGAYWPDEADPDGRQSVDRLFQFGIDEILDEANPPSTGDPFLDTFFGLRPVFDVVTGEQLIDPADLVDEPEPEPEPVPEPTPVPEDVVDDPEVTSTPEDDGSLAGLSGVACWLCWGTVAIFFLLLLAVLYIWLKKYDWWTCWLPWFIVIFVWVPFLLAGMWWWRPSWWWVPLLAWFPIVAGYTWYWGQQQSWWQQQYLYVVGGYLAALVVGMVVVGGPEWGLLLPLFWLPWAAFYLWFRGQHQPWWQPWMWYAFGAYAVWNFVWVASLTPWWAWWLPVLFIVFVPWWFRLRGHSWQTLRGPKWCWVIPFTMLPFLAWWIPLWGSWWCWVVFLVLVLTMVCTFVNHDVRGWWAEWRRRRELPQA